MLLLSGFGRDQLAKRTWDRLKDRWIQLHLVLPRLNPGEGDRELFPWVHSMRIVRVFIMTELVKAKLLRVPAKFSRPCNYSFHLCIIRISLAVALVVVFHDRKFIKNENLDSTTTTGIYL